MVLQGGVVDSFAAKGAAILVASGWRGEVKQDMEGIWAMKAYWKDVVVIRS